MKTHTVESYLKEIDVHLQKKFFKLQSYETKLLTENGFLKPWEADRVKEGVREIQYFNWLIAELKAYQLAEFDKPDTDRQIAIKYIKANWSKHADLYDVDKWEIEADAAKRRYIENHFNHFKKSQPVIEIMKSKGNFIHKIMDNLEKGIGEFIEKTKDLSVTSYEYEAAILNLMNGITAIVNLYRKLKYGK